MPQHHAKTMIQEALASPHKSDNFRRWYAPFQSGNGSVDNTFYSTSRLALKVIRAVSAT